VTEQTKQKNKANKRSTGSRHGLTALKAQVSARGMAAVDGRTKAMRAVAAWKRDLIRDLGGDLSLQQQTLVDMAAKTMLYLNNVDSWLMQQDSLVNKRKRSILPVLRERQTLCDSLNRILGQLGLDRVARDSGALPESWITKVKPVEDQDVQQQAHEHVQQAEVPDLAKGQVGKDGDQ
jgi:hypothetical protein